MLKKNYVLVPRQPLGGETLSRGRLERGGGWKTEEIEETGWYISSNSMSSFIFFFFLFTAKAGSHGEKTVFLSLIPWPGDSMTSHQVVTY